jgi:uncharacterized protein (TIRG00374 family)
LNKKVKKLIFILLPIALGVFLIWYSISQLTPNDITDIKYSFKTANYFWVLVSLFLGVLSHLSRAYRWQFMLEPLGYKPKFANSIMTVLIAYLLNLVIPRSGEFARATAISKYEKIPFEKAFGTIVAERIADVIMLLIIITTALILQFDLIKKQLFGDDFDPTKKIVILLVGLSLVFILYRLFKKSQNKVVLKIKTFFNGLKEGIASILKMEKKWAFIFHTIFIWLMYVLMFYAVSFALPETSNLAFEAIIVGFVVGALSMALTNGGLGTYPVLVASALILYNIPENPAKAFGWIMWTAQTLMVLVFGGLSFLFLPIYNRDKSNSKK